MFRVLCEVQCFCSHLRNYLLPHHRDPPGPGHLKQQVSRTVEILRWDLCHVCVCVCVSTHSSMCMWQPTNTQILPRFHQLLHVHIIFDAVSWYTIPQLPNRGYLENVTGFTGHVLRLARHQIFFVFPQRREPRPHRHHPWPKAIRPPESVSQNEHRNLYHSFEICVCMCHIYIYFAIFRYSSFMYARIWYIHDAPRENPVKKFLRRSGWARGPRSNNLLQTWQLSTRIGLEESEDMCQKNLERRSSLNTNEDDSTKPCHILLPPSTHAHFHTELLFIIQIAIYATWYLQPHGDKWWLTPWNLCFESQWFEWTRNGIKI